MEVPSTAPRLNISTGPTGDRRRTNPNVRATPPRATRWPVLDQQEHGDHPDDERDWPIWSLPPERSDGPAHSGGDPSAAAGPVTGDLTPPAPGCHAVGRMYAMSTHPAALLPAKTRTAPPPTGAS